MTLNTGQLRPRRQSLSLIPSSGPDYRFKPTNRMRLTRIWACVFYVGYVVGRITSLLSRARRRILIIRTDGLGDGVLSEPMIRSIAERYPSAEIHLWAPESTCELFAAASYIKEIRVIPRGFKAGCLEYLSSPRWRWKMGWRMGSRRFAIAIYPAISPEPLGNWVISNVRSQKCWAVKGDLFHQFPAQQKYTLNKATRVLAKPRAEHELAANADLALQCGAGQVNDFPQISITPADQQIADAQIARWKKLAADHGACGLLGVVATGSMEKFSWPKEKWRDAIEQIEQRHGLLSVLLSTQDVEFAVAAKLDAPVNVRALAAILGQLDAVLTLDTGPAHLAAAMGTPIVVLSNGGHPRRFFPWPEAPWVKSLVKPMACAHCVCRCPLAEAECLTGIDVGDVLTAVAELRRTPLRQAA